tara:strand:+ start:11286 stop:11759 length:474 start_codon:yes stop_codon:yes gene_type:complete
MDSQDKLNLKRLISEYKPEETTSKIRTLKHSSKIKEDVERYLRLKSKYARLPRETQLQMYRNQCQFLYTNYTNIFNKLVKEQLDLTILYRLLIVLKGIEDGKYDQHEGSVMVGEILKQLYIDSALKGGNQNEKKSKKERKRKGKKISWAEYKRTEMS